MGQEKLQLFKHWDGVSNFYIWDAGYLWIEVDPNDDAECKHSNNHFQPIKRMLVESIRDGRLVAHYPFKGHRITHHDFFDKFPAGSLYSKFFDWKKVILDREDLKRYAEKIDEAPLFLFAEKRPVGKGQDNSLENFISGIKVWCENDIEIVIQEPSKKARTFGHESLGCRESDTLEWLTLQKIIKSPSLLFKYGDSPASEKKLLQRVEDKVKALLTKEFGIEFPAGFKLYSSLGGGEFEFKFKSKQYEEFPQENFANYSIDRLKQELKLRYGSGRPIDVIAIANELKEQGVSDSELQSIIQLDSIAGLDQIKFDPYENESLDE